MEDEGGENQRVEERVVFLFIQLGEIETIQHLTKILPLALDFHIRGGVQRVFHRPGHHLVVSERGLDAGFQIQSDVVHRPFLWRRRMVHP